MKVFKIILIFFIIAILAVAVLNKIQLQKFKRMYDHQKAENTRIEEDAKKIENAFIKAQMASMMHLGKKLFFGNIKKIYHGNNSQKIIKKNPKFVLIFSELGCNVCQDNETKFAVNFTEKFGEDFVLAVVYANNRRYVRNYIRINKVNFPVYFCEDDIFFNDNNINNTPMIFVIDEEDRIIASHFPLPGHPEYSEPIHQFCIHYFEQFSCFKDL